MRGGRPVDPEERAARIAHVLGRCGLTAKSVSRASQAPPFDRQRCHALRPDFLGQIRRGHEPHVFQFASLSALTGTSFEEWLALFGYCSDTVLRWQIALHSTRTVPLSSKAHAQVLQRLWSGLQQASLPARAVPTEETIDAASFVESVWPAADTSLYLKLGRDDRLLPSRFAAGSYVRVDTSRGLPEEIGSD